MSTINCPQCGQENRRAARFCKSCGANLSPTRLAPATPEANTAPQPKAGGLLGLVQAIKHRVTGKEPASSLQQAPSPATTRPMHVPEAPATPQPVASPPPDRPAAVPRSASPAASLTIERLRPLPRGTTLTHPQDPRLKYSIVVARELDRSIYYDALDLTCPTCQASQPNLPPDGLCRQCHTPLQPVLIHERRPRLNRYLSNADLQQLLHLSAGHPNILRHQAILQYQDNTYTVVEHPGRWGVLTRGRQQRSPDEALAGTVQVGQALVYLYEHGFAYCEAGSVSLENLVLVGGEGSVKLADLGTCVCLQLDDAQTMRAQANSDLTFLARLLFYLATGQDLPRTTIDLAPSALRPFIERAMQGQYDDVRDLLADFLSLPSTPLRSLKPSHGQATHPGRRHTRNEDAVVTFTFDKEQDRHAVPMGFYLVADGMGGHDAGDVASRTVNQIVADWIIKTKVLPDLRKATRKLAEDVPGEVLVQAIQEANQALLQHGQAKGGDPGSTVTAALVIGDLATIANVGDSRTYLLRDGRLEQITQDHSLVARLADAGIIQPEEVRTHPQRNQIYRSLGHKPAIAVDTFTRQLQAGDVLVLCSDGLWEMVPDADIQRIIEGAASPQKACDALLEAANRAGGEDNIAVVVVEME